MHPYAMAILHGLEALESALKAGTITPQRLETAVRDIHTFPEAVDFFLSGCHHWSLAQQGRGLANYLMLYYPQEV